jgi:trehalose synthase-fused probable maltokinase
VSIDNHIEIERELNQSLTWITGQRWFGDKDRALQSVTIERSTVVTEGRQPVVFCIVRCTFASGAPASYFLPVTRPEQDGLRDAFTDEDFRTWFFEGFAHDRAIETDDGTWHWHRTGRSDGDLRGVRATNSEVLRREQSNTSIVYDDRLIAKVFRKLEAGVNPDVEIGQMFAASGAEVHTPHLVGTMSFDHDDHSMVIAILQQFVHNRGDGWSWLIDVLAHRAATSLDAIELLGRRTGEMHLALAGNSDDAAFKPEPVTDRDLKEMQLRIGKELDETVSGLKRLGALTGSQADQLHRSLQDKISTFDALKGTVRIRVHGDYHLGQVLRTVEGDFSIIDFEGEPSRPLAERRRKSPALRDVAGMVRSLDYAVQSVRREQPHRNDLLEWLDDATQAFVTGYKSVISLPTTLVPMEPTSFDAALEVLSIEKALYETRYEMGNRPDWLEIPLGALQRIASG